MRRSRKPIYPNRVTRVRIPPSPLRILGNPRIHLFSGELPPQSLKYGRLAPARVESSLTARLRVALGDAVEMTGDDRERGRLRCAVDKRRERTDVHQRDRRGETPKPEEIELAPVEPTLCEEHDALENRGAGEETI